ncbi:spore germination protein [Paenibacillus sp. FSL H7-0357]|uniref:spore germination protein n=1 Tax=unclassified Paenibacillus TaxID=185978 RepID=UPI00069253A9|nr:spore germination protein [Paenibacillus sp. FSL H7-0357]
MRFRKRNKVKKPQVQHSESQPAHSEEPISACLGQNLQQIRQTVGNSTDIIIREVRIGKDGSQTIAILYTDGLVDKNIVSDFIMKSMMLDSSLSEDVNRRIQISSNVLQILKDYTLTIGDIRDITDFETLYNALLSGDAIILIDGETKGIVVSAGGWKDRGVTEPASENVVRGPREGFSETLGTNTALIRRKIKDPNLWLETKQIGRVTKTDVALMYINGIANHKLVEEVHERLNRIDVDGILEGGYIEEFIQDKTFTPFPTVYNSERPDVIAAELLEGKIAILVDGTPFVLIVPALFVSFLHAAEDYYQRADISSFIRILRYTGVFISLLGPSLYIAITTFHQEMLPTSLLIGLAAQREAVPFPAFIEALMMELTFEILREAGVRMPKYIGAAVSIVGTLVIGQAAVEAGIISAAMVIVVSITAISSFVLPAYNMSIAFRMLRFPLMGLAASFGLYGIIVGGIALILHLCSLRSFGVPYMSPLAPLIPADTKDTLIRLPHWLMVSRPRLLNQKNVNRESLHPENHGNKPEETDTD